MTDPRKTDKGVDKPKPNHVYVLKREAGGEPFVFEFEDATYTIPHTADMDVFRIYELVEAAPTESQLMLNLFREAMGDKDFATLRASGMNGKTFEALGQAWQDHCGISVGESPASSD